MVSPATSKLPKLPWPALVGVSLVLHAGALSLGLPLMLRVEDTPASSSINIPVTLVDENAVPIAPSESPAAPAPRPVENRPPVPIGGETAAAEPRVTTTNNPTTNQPPQPETAPQQPDLSRNETIEPSDRPTINDSRRETHRAIANPPATDNETIAGEGGQPSNSTVGQGSIAISIVGISTVPPNTPGDWPDSLPTLQSTSTLRIANHTCNDALPAGEIVLGLEIAADGSVIQTFAPTDKNTVPAQIASCLLNHAVSVDPSVLRFSPAYTGQNPIATDRMQLTVEFSAN